ncbi:MAG: hypothetical protein CSB32_02015 [Desulfobacterales bacterium]|nr:MAG: hypothetical protein CSB32_02015 [Desulfobacterales bacterium]
MNIRKSFILSIVLCLVFLGVALDAHSDQNPSTTAVTGKSMDNQVQPKSDESAAPSEKTEATAKMVVAEPLFQFEPVLDGESVSHTFTIKNTGTAELKILKVRTG